MSFPNFPNPARRAKILQAHQLRQQGLTLRQIAQRMDCAHSTVSVYLSDFELFRTDLIQELAADQIVSHVIQLADLADEHHDRRLAALRALRLLLTAVPQIRRDEDDRVRELTQGGVSVDRYGNRYPAPSRIYPPTPQETAELEQHAQLPAQTELDPDQPLAIPLSPLAANNATLPDPLSPPCGGRCHGVTEGGSPDEPTDQPADQPATPIRTKSNKSEHETSQNPAHNGKSAINEQKNPPPTEHTPPSAIPDEICAFLKHSTRDWINDYPQHNPNHPLRQAALQLKAEAKAAALPRPIPSPPLAGTFAKTHESHLSPPLAGGDVTE